MITTKIICDCCLSEIPEDKIFKLEHYIHVSPSYNRISGHSLVIDGKTYSISRRTESKEFCLPCYNSIFQNVFEHIKTIRETKFPIK